ncbi:hypothetical protein NKJ87_20080 [Mesorhizobium sp. M0027]|uniref:hypothetical protein n=1 Tax=Mesorhizobium sp. M0027 TaxID=2956848 RepID=UPI0033371282
MANEIRDAFNVVYADGPTSAPSDPAKSEVRSIGGLIQNAIDDLDTRTDAIVGLDTRLTAAEAAEVGLDTRLTAVEGTVISGVKPLSASVLLATTGNIVLSGEQTIDGTLTSASDVAVWKNTDKKENGVYTSAAGAWVRRADLDIGAELLGSRFMVRQGTVYGGYILANTNSTAPLVGTDNITFTEYQKADPSDHSEILTAREGAAALNTRLANREKIALRRNQSTSSEASRIAELEAQVDALFATLSTRVDRLDKKTGAAIVYADPTATGSANGTSWANAFTTLGAAFAAVAEGGSVYTNSTQANPFPTAAITGAIPNSIAWITNAGAAGETWISGKLTASWTDMGSGIFRCTPVGTVAAVAYDLKADDTAGTVTGIDLTTAENVADLAEWGIAAADCVAWYGLLEKEAVGTATPAEGKWSVTGGFLYINPPGSPVLATVNSLASYANTSDGISFTKTGSVHEGLHHRGKLTVFFTPSNTAGTGYSFKHNNAKNCVVESVRSIMCGYHAIGFANGTEEGVVIRNCLTTQHAADSAGTANPYVFHTQVARNIPNAGHMGEGLVFLGVPLLKTTGAPLTSSYGPGLGYSHTDGTYALGGITWSRCLQVDFLQELEAKHSVTISSFYKFIAAENSGGTFARFDPNTWPVKAIGCKARGRAAWFQQFVDHYGCRMDRSGYGAQGNLLVLMNSAPALWHFRMTDCLIWTGECRRAWSGMEVGETISMRLSDPHARHRLKCRVQPDPVSRPSGIRRGSLSGTLCA